MNEMQRWARRLAVCGAAAAMWCTSGSAFAQGTAIPFDPPISSYPGDPWAVGGPSDVDLIGLEVVPAGAIPPIGVPYADAATASSPTGPARTPTSCAGTPGGSRAGSGPSPGSSAWAPPPTMRWRSAWRRSSGG